LSAERLRIRRVYAGYRNDPRYLQRFRNEAAQQFMLERKWTQIRNLLEGAGARPRPASVLVLGAGDGRDGRGLERCGFAAETILSLDLLREETPASGAARPPVPWVIADAAQIPFRDGTFDMVYQSTLISSVIDPRVRHRIYLEIARVLRLGGLFLSYDMRYRNPWNSHTRALPRRELRREFTGWRLRARSVTGLPVLARLLLPRWSAACRLLESLAPLRSHLLALLEKPPSRAEFVGLRDHP
jgi:SAM-dependent methyltransferase